MTIANVPVPRQTSGEWLEVTPGERFNFRVSNEETAGAYVMLEVVADPGNGVPMHLHKHEDEHFLILEGTLRVANGHEPVDVPAGTAVTVRRGVPHAWANMTNTPVHFLLVFSPGRIEELLRQNIATKNDLAAAAANANRFGTVIVGPPIAEGLYTFASPRP
ncbi:MAG TPA: cupin domain-containing protein [Rhodopila sp.]|nr:cupin domain-containing protein [Rhodopila sp.]